MKTEIIQKIQELLATPPTADVLEAATDAAIEHLDIDGDELSIIWDTKKPRRDAIEVPGFRASQVPCIILPNTRGTALSPAEKAEILAAVDCNTLTWDGRTGAHWIVIKMRHLKGLRAWAIVDKSATLGEDPTRILTESGPLALYALETEGHLVREGRLARHCIGSRQMGYRRSLGSVDIAYVSVRRKEAPELPVATAEIRGTRIIQIQGRSNSAVSQDTRAIVERYAATR